MDREMYVGQGWTRLGKGWEQKKNQTDVFISTLIKMIIIKIMECKEFKEKDYTIQRIRESFVKEFTRRIHFQQTKIEVEMAAF